MEPNIVLARASAQLDDIASVGMDPVLYHAHFCKESH